MHAPKYKSGDMDAMQNCLQLMHQSRAACAYLVLGPQLFQAADLVHLAHVGQHA